MERLSNGHEDHLNEHANSHKMELEPKKWVFVSQGWTKHNIDFVFLSYGVYVVENSPFLQFCPDLSKKSKSIKAIYIYAAEGSRYALSENGIVYYAMTTVLEI